MKTGIWIIALLILAGCSKTDFSDEDTETSARSSSSSPDSHSAPNPAADRAKADCEFFRSGLGFIATPLSAGAEVRDLTGSGIFKASQVRLVTGITGSLILLGVGPQARVERIQNVEGSVLICGMDVDQVSDVAGSVIVIDGAIGAVDRITGSALSF